MTLAELIDRWPAIVGPDFAARLKLSEFSIGGTLHIRAVRALAAHELAPTTATLLALLPHMIDGYPVKRIRWLPPEHAEYVPPTPKRNP